MVPCFPPGRIYLGGARMFSTGEMRTRRGDGIRRLRQTRDRKSQGRERRRAPFHCVICTQIDRLRRPSLHPFKNACETKYRLFHEDCCLFDKIQGKWARKQPCTTLQNPVETTCKKSESKQRTASIIFPHIRHVQPSRAHPLPFPPPSAAMASFPLPSPPPTSEYN